MQVILNLGFWWIQDRAGWILERFLRQGFPLLTGWVRTPRLA